MNENTGEINCLIDHRGNICTCRIPSMVTLGKIKEELDFNKTCEPGITFTGTQIEFLLKKIDCLIEQRDALITALEKFIKDDYEGKTQISKKPRMEAEDALTTIKRKIRLEA